MIWTESIWKAPTGPPHFPHSAAWLGCSALLGMLESVAPLSAGTASSQVARSHGTSQHYSWVWLQKWGFLLRFSYKYLMWFLATSDSSSKSYLPRWSLSYNRFSRQAHAARSVPSLPSCWEGHWDSSFQNPAHIHLMDQTVRVWLHWLLLIFCLHKGFSTWLNFQSSPSRAAAHLCPSLRPTPFLSNSGHAALPVFSSAASPSRTVPETTCSFSGSEAALLPALLCSASSKFSFLFLTFVSQLSSYGNGKINGSTVQIRIHGIEKCCCFSLLEALKWLFNCNIF